MKHSPAWRAVVVAILRPLLFWLLKRDWKGQSNIPREGGVIIAANHLSWSDPLALAHFVYKSGRFPVFLAKSALFAAKGLGAVLRKTGQIPVYRDRTDAGLALRDAERGLRDGECLIFYPEGTCTRDPKLWPMTGKTGAARLALTAGVPVIPVAHWGAQRLWPYGTKKFRPFPRKRMHVIAGPPVDLSAYEGAPINTETLTRATADIMRAIADLLAQLRGEPAPETLYDHRAALRAKHAEANAEAEAGAVSEADSAPKIEPKTGTEAPDETATGTDTNREATAS
jgi:1-acyl-sn-glycerol-3-phosphate acyltransferase